MAECLQAGSWMVLLLPLLGLLGGLPLGCWRWRWAAGWTVSVNLLAAAWAWGLAIDWLQGPPEAIVPGWSFIWFALGDGFDARFGALLDGPALMMSVVVTSIATLVHIYSIGYMREDRGAGRFFPLLSFFVFAMLLLVQADNLLHLFVGWELVGVASYLLIGFWYHKPSAVRAGQKAFVVNRFADAFFLLGIVLTAWCLGGLDLRTLAEPASVPALNEARFGGLPLLSVATLCLFAGAWGKSAMFPLHIWLPDAMEGPTPVSSIIHSATMVVAGVFLTARLLPIFIAADGTMLVVELTGLVTAVVAALVACTQLDLKRILAFSTLSQLGYMMFALGTVDAEHAAGYTASLFHIFTHAWFKCLLFLVAGVVIHRVHAGSLADMGGLRRQLPWSWATGLIACLAIAGMPFTAGWYSKDLILFAAWESGHRATALIGLAVGGLTAYYMFRAFMLAFHGQPRGRAAELEALSATTAEPWSMRLPMLALALPSLVAGALTVDVFSQRFLFAPVAAGHDHPAWLLLVASGVGPLGLVVAWALHRRRAVVVAPRTGLGRVVDSGFGIDRLWQLFFHALVLRRGAAFARWFDDAIVDGILHGSARATHSVAAVVRFVQNGQVHRYLAVMLLGLILIALFGGLVP